MEGLLARSARERVMDGDGAEGEMIGRSERKRVYGNGETNVM